MSEAHEKYPRLFQWSLADTRGIREFPGWIADAPEIWGYTGMMSYTEGEQVDLRVHTTGRTFSVRVERDGHKPQVVFQRGDAPGTRQPTPDNAAIKGCGWKPSLSIETKGWHPGVYVVYLSTRDEGGREATGEHFFLVRSRQPGSVSNLCLVLCTSTYTAYNDWGGANHYRSIRDGISTDVMEPILSLQRPWARGFVKLPREAPDVVIPDTPAPFWKPDYPQVGWALANAYSRHYPDAGWATYEQRFVKWAEKSGYMLEFATQHDLQQHPETFANYRCLIVVGHDEYWSWEMRDTVDTFVDAGGHIGRFGGNFLWQVRLEDDGRRQVCYKTAKHPDGRDPLLGTAQQSRATTKWNLAPVNRPGAQTMGLTAMGYSRYGGANPRSSGGFTVYRPWHWAFDKTDLYYGDVFGAAPTNVFGFEVDGIPYLIKDGLPSPTGEDGAPANLQLLALAPSSGGEPDRWNGEVPLNAPLKVPPENPIEPGADMGDGDLKCGAIAWFERGKGSVFNAGSCSWVRGLDSEDFFTMQITRNVLNRFGQRTS